MAIRKPSDYFNNENNSIEETIQDNAENSELNTFSDAYNAFKRNLSKVDVLNNFSETLGNYQDNVEKVNYLSEKIDEIDKDIKNLLTKEDLDKALISQLLFLEECIRDVQEKVKGINHKNLTQVKLDISNLSETVNIFIDEEIPRYEKLVVESETRLIDKCDVLEDELKDTLDNIKDVIDEKYISDFKSLNEEINKIKTSENTRDELNKKIVDLEVEILRNESHIKSQNKNIEDIHGDVKSAIDRLNIGKIEENNFKLGEKIKYLEEVFEKFNEKELLNENIIAEPSSTDNDDPLTPLDKNFVTLDQLQNHYRLFINRIQQQLASFGGGGEVRLEFLDDVDRDSAKVNGKFLKYDSASGKWLGADASGGAGSQTLDETLGLGNTSSRGMSVGIVTSTKLHIDPVGSGVTFNEDLVVVGDARVTGILSIGTSSIVLDPNAKTISGVEELQVGETTIKNDSEGNITFVNTFNPAQTINVGIGSTASVNTTGIITASSFTGSLIGTATNATNLNNQAASYYLNYNNFSNTPTALSSFSNDVGFVTSSVVVGYATEGFVNSAVAGIVSSAPATLDTLNELSQALDNDANFSTTVTNLIGTKASLSGATFAGIITGTLDGTASNANNLNNQPASYYLDYTNFTNTPTIPGRTGDLVNNSGFVTSGIVVGYATEGFVSNLVSISTFSGNYNDLSNTPTALSSFSNDVGFITAGASGAGLTALTGASSGTYGNSTNSAQITVDSNGRITSISQVAISGGGGGISGIKILNGETSLGVTTNLSFGNNLNALSIGNTVSVSLTGVVTSLVGYATEGFVSNLVSISTFSGNYNDLSNTPTALSSFSNDVGFVTSGVVVGYATEGFVSNLVSISTFSGNYNDLSNTPTIPGRTGDLVNNSGFVTSGIVVGYATEGFVNSAVAGIVSSAPTTLDTLNELAQALGDDANFSTTVTNLIGTKASLSGAAFTGIVTAPSFSGAIELSSDTSPQLGGNLFTNGNDIFVADNDLLRLGSGYDFVMTHDGTNTTLKNHTGDLIIGTYGGEYPADDIIIESADDFEVRLNTGMNPGSGTTAIYATGGGSVALNHNSSTKFETTASGIDVTGNITVSGTVDGRDLVTDGTKLDNIASNATAYSDSDVDSHLNRTQQVSQNYVLSWNGSDYAWVAQSGGGGISNVVEDTTPQLGGNLDLNSKDITGTGNLNVSGIVTATSFSGAIELSSDTSPQLGGILQAGHNITFDNSVAAIFGFNEQLSIIYDGTDNHIKSSDKDLNIELNPDLSAPKIYIRPNTSHQGITLGGGSGNPVELYHNNSKKFETTGAGVTVTGTTKTDQLNVNDVYHVEAESSSFTASAGVAYTANTYTASDFVNAEYTLFFQHSSGIQSQKVLVMDDGSTAYSQEYGIMSSNGLLVSVGATVKSSNVELLFTPETGVTGIVTYRFTRGTIS